MTDKMNILTEGNLQEIREYIVETIKRDIDRYADDYSIVDLGRVRDVVTEYVDDTTEEILNELKPQMKKKLKRDLAKILGADK